MLAKKEEKEKKKKMVDRKEELRASPSVVTEDSRKQIYTTAHSYFFIFLKRNFYNH
jgi:hypothetical protein